MPTENQENQTQEETNPTEQTSNTNPITPPINTDDPLVLEYADTLKNQIGKLYDSSLDALPVKERISAMKLIKGVMDKMPVRSEGKPPIEPKPASMVEKVKNHVERQEAGLNTINTRNPTFNIKLNKGMM